MTIPGDALSCRESEIVPEPVARVPWHGQKRPERSAIFGCLQARHLVDRACTVALTNRTVATSILPEDVAEEDAVLSPPRVHGAVFSKIPTRYLRPGAARLMNRVYPPSWPGNPAR